MGEFMWGKVRLGTSHAFAQAFAHAFAWSSRKLTAPPKSQSKRPDLFGFSRAVCAACLICMGGSTTLKATDFFLTLGGGYNRSGNQASLEANVIFFQQILTEQHQGVREHKVFFADGTDPGEDLQVLADKPQTSDMPATDVLAALHRRGNRQQITYRNHRVADVTGPLDPELVRAELDTLAKIVGDGDRLIIFVTAHGSEGDEDDPFNTSIDCWDRREISAREFAGWLDQLPIELPVVMIMAQCYCGGFGHTIFTDLDEAQGLSTHLRAGFFAQQYDLPAAGCRPDIEHDEEYSSYFWGAIAGRSRNGVPTQPRDLDNNGVISFAEAHAHAVITGETIDIPLRTSEVLLRSYSQLAPSAGTTDNASLDPVDDTGPVTDELLHLTTMSGSLENLLIDCRPVVSHIVTELAKTLEISLQDDIATWIDRDQDRPSDRRPPGRGRNRRGSGRRDLLQEVAGKWPELGNPREWSKSPLLHADNQATLLAELQALPSWTAYDQRRQQMATADQASDREELRSVKLLRLIYAVESIVLDKNLPLVATPQVVAKYEQILALENSSLPTPANPAASK